VAEKPAFRSAFRSRRMAVLADGFYEWGAGPGRQRQASYFHRADGGPMALAGLWEAWHGDAERHGDGLPDGSGPQQSCSIVTVAANGDMAGIHDRMPLVIEPDVVATWLDPEAVDGGELESVLCSGREGVLAHHRVGPRVGSVANDGPELLERADPGTPGVLFE
jgi:putative SOS response-associated peptidase YedK